MLSIKVIRPTSAVYQNIYIHLVDAVVVVCGIRLNFTFGAGHDARSLSVVTHGLAERASLQNVSAGQSPIRVKSRTPFASQGMSCRRLILKVSNGFLTPFMINCRRLTSSKQIPFLDCIHCTLILHVPQREKLMPTKYTENIFSSDQVS